MGIEIRHILKRDFPEVIGDLAEIQGWSVEQRESELDVLDWWFFRNPLGDGIYAGAFEGDRLAAVASITPKSFRIDGELVLGAEIGRTMTHSDFRGQGLFTQLVEHLIGECRSRGIEIVFGTPNEASGRIYIGRLGWTPIFHPDRFLRPLDWGNLGARGGGFGRLSARLAGYAYDLVRPSVLRGFNYEVLREVDTELSDFLGKGSARSGVHIERTLDYLQWRFKHPGANHEHLLLRSSAGELVGWAAFDDIDARGVSRLRVGDLWVSEDKAVRESALIAALIAEGRKRSSGQIYAVARTPSESMLHGNGLIRRPTAMPVIAFAPLGLDLRQLSAWEYREADADMF